MTFADRLHAAIARVPRERLKAALAVLAIAVVAAASLLALLLGSLRPAPSVADCKEALRAQYHAALVAGIPGSRPTACDGIDDATIGRLAGEVIAEEATR